MIDLNHDGKEDAMDYALLDEITKDDNYDSGHRHKSSGLGNKAWGFAALLYLSVFLNGSIGFGIIRALLGVVSIGIILVWMGGGLG